MEILIGMAILLALNEWRDFKFSRKHNLITSEIKRLSRQISKLSEETKKAQVSLAEIPLLKEELQPIQAFITKAQTDLETIVKEYEVNGVPLGYDRTGGQQYDMVEGL